MTQATDHRAHRDGQTIKKCCGGTVYTDSVPCESVYNGNRSRKSPRYERCIESFVRRRERGGWTDWMPSGRARNLPQTIETTI